VVVLSGSLRMVVGERAEDLSAGDSIVFNADVKHVYENPGTAEGRYHDLIIYKR
jgi:mannose-6-phosphate isomerase-like protein (cupin superfamily)